MNKRLEYYKRIISAYIFNKKDSNLRFWHTELKVNSDFGNLTSYYLDYSSKADYPGPFDEKGVPMLNYYGDIGVQYNPDAIAQYALGHYERYVRHNSEESKKIFLKQADWYVNNLREREKGIGVWEYDFDFEYFQLIKGPWYTSLGQGHGISVLVRAYFLTHQMLYLEAARKAFRSLQHTVDIDGGVKYFDAQGDIWLEEVPMNRPTHILNGFVWALWGLNDYWLATKEQEAKCLFDSCIKTLEKNIGRYDNGFWSRYDLAPTQIPGIASGYYHRLHVLQLRVMYILTQKEIFKTYSDKWNAYAQKRTNNSLAFIYKAIFKLIYY